uniref:Uncharacterized protein n=1 Tax=Anguilla anguilla TaxID=7936 RepID=A0A0E9UV12_ANGAN
MSREKPGKLTQIKSCASSMHNVSCYNGNKLREKETFVLYTVDLFGLAG